MWETRKAPTDAGSALSQLLAADGYDTQFAGFDERCWRDFVIRRIADLGITADRSVFEVGCGAGAFLHEMHRMGCAVGGVDWSPDLVQLARIAMPGGDFSVGDAADLEEQPRADVVVACGVFFYFPSLDYASRVIAKMTSKSTHAVAILDLPDRDREEAAIEFRRSAIGEDAYAEHYEGLDHLFYERGWIRRTLSDVGLTDITVVDQDLAEYGNAPFRFNAWGFKRRA